ncbi:MAG: hypothetical protein A2X64_08935 [Ignavibacteria bacterium GWF2_33_9]|nr:MAG: hypothetical protein A2X64_08935 [Ignavibacteria bacterium GWF2_33_9]
MAKKSPVWTNEHYNQVLDIEKQLNHCICGAKSNRKNNQVGICTNPPISINGRCTAHGGYSQVGKGPKRFNKIKYNAIKSGVHSLTFKNKFLYCDACRYRFKCNEYNQGSVCGIDEILFVNKYKNELIKIKNIVTPDIMLQSLIEKLIYSEMIAYRIINFSRMETNSKIIASYIQTFIYVKSKEQKIFHEIQNYISALRNNTA